MIGREEKRMIINNYFYYFQVREIFKTFKQNNMLLWKPNKMNINFIKKSTFISSNAHKLM